MTEAALILFIFAFGACIGSFLNVVVYRLPRNESVSFPPSHCPRCNTPIPWYRNIPILSWLMLRGRCFQCRTPISPQYILVETATGLMLAGLYLAYFVFDVRDGAEALTLDGSLAMFAAHSALLCGLLACSLVDIRYFLVPLSVMWTVSLMALAACVIQPHPLLPSAGPGASAAALGAGVGLLGALWAVRKGWLPTSMIDAPDRAEAPAARKGAESKPPGKGRARKRRKGRKRRGAVGATSGPGMNIRVEMAKELAFLAPALLLALAAWALLTRTALAASWAGLFDAGAHPLLGPRLAAVGGALLGYLVGGLWIWATRILGSLAAGREAMGMGDVHILAGVGAAGGWLTATLAFFLAPVAGLAVAIYLLAAKKRELPYGPWLAVGAALALLCQDPIVDYFRPSIEAIFGQ